MILKAQSGAAPIQLAFLLFLFHFRGILLTHPRFQPVFKDLDFKRKLKLREEDKEVFLKQIDADSQVFAPSPLSPHLFLSPNALTLLFQ